MNMNSNNAMISHLIVDSSGFIKNAPLKDIGENVYTVSEVVNEIRDKNTRQRLQVLPYQLNLVSPLATSLNAVTEFSKKTGDYASLSATDLKLVALVHQLSSLHDKSLHIKSQPNNLINWNSNTPSDINLTNIPGFYFASKTKKEHRIPDCFSEYIANPIDNEIATEVSIIKNDDFKNLQINDDKLNENALNNGSNVVQNDLVSTDKNTVEADDESDEDEDEVDDVGWVTPGNLNAVMRDSAKELMEVQMRPLVACLTTDFAMQNVLIQMGLKVISMDGFLIKRVRSYVLHCFSCFKVSKDTNRQFCHHCGNMSLLKVAMSIGEDGEISYHKKKVPSARGTRYSLPMPKGGKHSWNAILCEDQLVPQQRLRKKDKRSNMDHIDLECPFAINDVKSRPNKHGFHVRPGQRKNPNDNSQSHRHKK